MVKYIFIFLTIASTVFPGPEYEREQFKSYWYKGEAELNRYSLEQARYSELHEGAAVLVFVTEPFLKDKQVKLDGPYRSGADNVLKLNRIHRFTTGVYDYSLMNSVFTAENAQAAPTYKVSTTVQDWCGHVFNQLNLDGDSYKLQVRSYFEAEADHNYS